MLPQTLMALLIAGNAVLNGAASFERAHEEPVPVANDAEIVGARYEATAREVTNWRDEASQALTPGTVVVLATLLGVQRPIVTRCVKLNNYWCIKSARWDGEIGTDGEGHVGFASAERGADAAATLLRRYYLDFNRKSALDIVRRWAPAECGVISGFGGMVLAVKGIGGTLRARYLAAHRVSLTASGPKTGKKGASSGRVSIVIPRAGALKSSSYRMPEIAAGVGLAPQKPVVAVPRRQTAAVPAKPSGRQPDAKPARVASAATSCAPDEGRLRNYADRMVTELDVGPNDDLKLFAADGTPLPNLVPVMLAMSSFELGMLRPHPELIEGAVARATMRVIEARKGDHQAEGR